MIVITLHGVEHTFRDPAYAAAFYRHLIRTDYVLLHEDDGEDALTYNGRGDVIGYVKAVSLN